MIWQKRNRNRHWLALGVTGFLLVLIVWALLGAFSPAQGQPAGERALAERERFGFVATASDWREAFDVGQLRAGWYVDATQPICDPAPEGMERAALLRVHTGYTVSPSKLGPMVDNHPGSLWLVGNEPDCIWQDNVEPEEYARIYHDVYTFIKGRDPTSRVSPGGIVQATPLRLQWLDRVLAAYQNQYGQALPVDVWNIHNAILNEQAGGWGADIPPGIDATEGVLRSVDDNDDMDIFEEQIWTFRQWMADNGYGGYPLIVTEYGILMPDDYGFGVDRVNAFMSATFDFFQNTTDPTLGDPSDGDRLVQRWAWFSLDVQPWDPLTGEGFNGNLFDPDTTAITAFGQHYAGHTAAFPPLNYVELEPGMLRTIPVTALPAPTQTLTRQLAVEVVNDGTVAAGSFEVALAFDGPASGALTETVPSLAGASSEWVTFLLPSLPVGGYDLTVNLDPGHQVDESSECNNGSAGGLVVPGYRLSLPLTAEAHAAASVDNSPNLERTAQGENSGFTHAIEEFVVPTGSSYPVQIALDAQDRLWIIQRDGNKVARYDPQSQTWDEYNIPTANSQPWGLALDGSGNVWFAETAANQIGKLDVSTGTITEYAVPTANSQPWGVTIGPNGAVWFTEKAGNKIGKFAPATETFDEYVIPTANSEPTGIAASSQYVWFTESAGNKLGVLTLPDGPISERFASPPYEEPLDTPQDVALTSGGNPWFTEMGGNRITLFRVSTLVDFHQIPVHTDNSEPYGIALESGDAAVWFTERAGNRLGRYSGSVPPFEFALPTPGSLPTDIVADGDGCVWYAAPGTNRIGRICPPFTFSIYLPIVVKNF